MTTVFLSSIHNSIAQTEMLQSSLGDSLQLLQQYVFHCADLLTSHASAFQSVLLLCIEDKKQTYKSVPAI